MKFEEISQVLLSGGRLTLPSEDYEYKGTSWVELGPRGNLINNFGQEVGLAVLGSLTPYKEPEQLLITEENIGDIAIKRNGSKALIVDVEAEWVVIGRVKYHKDGSPYKHHLPKALYIRGVVKK
jgi:hypothetical protein